MSLFDREVPSVDATDVAALLNTWMCVDFTTTTKLPRNLFGAQGLGSHYRDSGEDNVPTACVS